MKLTLVSIEKELIRVATEGNITSVDFGGDGVNPLQQLLGETWSGNRVLLNLAQSTYIDSSAIGWLISSSRSFRAAGGSLVIHSLPPSVKQIMDVLKVQRVVPTAEDEAAARAIALGQGAPA